MSVGSARHQRRCLLLDFWPRTCCYVRLPHERVAVHSCLPVSATRCVVRHRSHLGRDEDYFSTGRGKKLPAEPLIWLVHGRRARAKQDKSWGIHHECGSIASLLLFVGLGVVRGMSNRTSKREPKTTGTLRWNNLWGLFFRRHRRNRHRGKKQNTRQRHIPTTSLRVPVRSTGLQF